MEIALIIVGLFVLAIIMSWAYTYLTDAETIDREETEEVRAESPEERERTRFEHMRKEEERRQDEISFYSRGESEE